MTRRQRYFIKQRIMGACMILISIILGVIIPGSIFLLGIILVPLGLTCLFSKQMVWTDKYYYEVKYGKRETR